MGGDFVTWALDPARTQDEAFCAELLTEQGLAAWHRARKTPDPVDWSTRYERRKQLHRQRRLNPAHRAALAAEDVERAAEMLPTLEEVDHWAGTDEPDRSLCDLSGLRFCPELRTLKIAPVELRDLSGLAAVPKLEDFWLQDCQLEDLSGLAACPQLRKVHLWLIFSWPDLRSLARLPELQEIVLHGNLCALAGVGPLPKVRKVLLNGWGKGRAHLRNAADLPFMPALLDATIYPWGRLEHIAERMPMVEALAIEGPYRDLSPLSGLEQLRQLQLYGDSYESLEPIARLPRLAVLTLSRESPIDLTPLLESESLRELTPLYGENLTLEMQAINAALGGWDPEFLAPAPRSLAPPIFRITQTGKTPHPDFAPRKGRRDGRIPKPIQKAEGRWLTSRLGQAITHWHGSPAWGELQSSEFDAARMRVDMSIHDIGVAEAFPELIEICRRELAAMRSRWVIDVVVSLEAGVPRRKTTRRDFEEMHYREQLENLRDSAQRRKEYREYLQKLHCVRELEEQGRAPQPEKFAPGPPEPKPDLSLPEFSVVNDEDDEPDRHPLWENYFLHGEITEEGCWVASGCAVNAERMLGVAPQPYPGWNPRDDD